MQYATKEEIAKKLTEILIEHLGVNPENVHPLAKIQEELGADSLDIVEIVLECEQEFEISIADEELETLETFQDGVNFLNSRINPSAEIVD